MGLEISDWNIFVSGMSDDVTRVIPLMAVASYRVLLGFDDDVTALAAIIADRLFERLVQALSQHAK